MSEHGKTVLLVEDEEAYVDALTVSLEREGYTVEVAWDGAEALDAFDRIHPDVVLLDLMLSKVSGAEVCRHIRARSTTPVIMVTARDSELDAVIGLEVGADDYVTKPYRTRELMARVRAALRRSHRAGAEKPDDAVQVGQVRLDRARHRVTVDGREIYLALKEFELLDELMSRAGRVCTREWLFLRVWGPRTGDTKTLDVHVKRLRAKLEDDPAHPCRIVTIRGVGYRYEQSHG